MMIMMMMVLKKKIRTVLILRSDVIDDIVFVCFDFATVAAVGLLLWLLKRWIDSY